MNEPYPLRTDLKRMMKDRDYWQEQAKSLRARAEKAEVEVEALLAAFPEYGSTGNELRETRAEVELLCEALRRIMGLDGRDETFCLDQTCGTCDECFARAALARSLVREGSPQTQRKLDRALAERVREACAKAVEVEQASGRKYGQSDPAENAYDAAAEAVRALDLDALLEEK